MEANEWDRIKVSWCEQDLTEVNDLLGRVVTRLHGMLSCDGRRLGPEPVELVRDALEGAEAAALEAKAALGTLDRLDEALKDGE